jgi:hypothetical protein
MANLREIKKAFFQLSQKEQELILKEIYGFSKDVKEFLNIRLLNSGEELYIEQIIKATDSSSKNSNSMPRTIQITKVNSILSKARKSKVKKETLCKMEWIAFEGYMLFLNSYGGPESYEDKVYDHLKNYLLLLKDISKDKELNDEYDRIKQYLRINKNMYYDHIWELFTEITGEMV